MNKQKTIILRVILIVGTITSLFFVPWLLVKAWILPLPDTVQEQLDEAIVTSAIAAVLTGNALIGFISKMTAKLMKKLNYKKGEDIAEKIHHWAHDNETAFQAPIKRVLAFFIKDKQKLDITTKAIYAIVIAGMAAGYGADAVSSLGKADWFKSALASLKTLAKSDEAIVNAYPAIKSLMV